MTDVRRQASLVHPSETFHCICEISTLGSRPICGCARLRETLLLGSLESYPPCRVLKAIIKVFNENQMGGGVGWEEGTIFKPNQNQTSPQPLLQAPNKAITLLPRQELSTDITNKAQCPCVPGIHGRSKQGAGERQGGQQKREGTSEIWGQKEPGCPVHCPAVALLPRSSLDCPSQ